MQPLHLAAGDVCNIAPPPSGMLCVAARLEVAQALFKAGVDAKAVDLQQCETPMHLACTCAEGNVEMVKLLLKHGAGARAEDKALATPISSAVLSKYYPEVWKVLEPIVHASQQGCTASASRPALAAGCGTRATAAMCTCQSAPRTNAGYRSVDHMRIYRC